MKKFKKSDLFELHYPNDWVYIEDLDSEIHSFCKEGNFNTGILNISAYTSNKNSFDARKECVKNRESEIIRMNGYEIVYFETIKGKHKILNWHTGYKNTLLFITYTVTKNNGKEELISIHEILKTLNIKLVKVKKRIK